jgi:hypothetical protein
MVVRQLSDSREEVILEQSGSLLSMGDIAYSPDGGRLFAVLDGKLIRYDFEQRAVDRDLFPTDRFIKVLSVSQGSSRWAVGLDNGTVSVREHDVHEVQRTDAFERQFAGLDSEFDDERFRKVLTMVEQHGAAN